MKIVEIPESLQAAMHHARPAIARAIIELDAHEAEKARVYAEARRAMIEKNGRVLPCGGVPKPVMIETSFGEVLAEVCVTCGEGYGRLSTDPKKITEFRKQLPPELATYCSGEPYPVFATQ